MQAYKKDVCKENVLKVDFCVGAAFGNPQVTNIKTVARTAKGGPYNIKFKMIQRTTFYFLISTY